jgi:hypothetical protein
MIYYLVPTSGKVLPFLGTGNFFAEGAVWVLARSGDIAASSVAVDDVL